MMIKNFLFAAALLSLALASGCATGGSGPCAVNCPSISIDDGSQAAAGLNLTIQLTATVKNTSQTAVNWAIQPASCGAPCGTLSNVTTSSATYNAPSSVPSNPEISIVATLQSDSSITASQDLTIIAETTDVAPALVNIGVGLTQQFTAVAVPDEAPQTFTWSCSAGGVQCVNFTPAPNVSSPGLAVYTPVANEECGNNCVQISAAATIDPTACNTDPKNCVVPKATVVTSRVSGTYAFRFSGFDKNDKPILVAGTFAADANGLNISGFEDEITASGVAQHSFSGGSYTPTAADSNNSNNAGTLVLNTGVFPNQYQVVLDGAGDIQMIASDGAGNSGSGFADLSTGKNKFSQGSNQTFAFGFTGADPSGNRIGYAGLLPTDGVANVTGGLIDVNDGGNSSNGICNLSAAPCSVAGSYTYTPATNRGQLTLTSPLAMTFDFFVANNGPLTLYAISTDSNPAVLGTMVLQDSTVKTYNNAAFNGTSVSVLTGASANVSLILGTTDGTSSGTGVTGACPGSNTGGFTGSFDQNNNGTMLSVGIFPVASQSPSPYTYVATNGNTGRYIFCLLGNPSATPSPTLPIPFVLYASAANRGFLLDQSSSAVITGTMYSQTAPKQNNFDFANTLLPGTYAVASNSNSSSSIAPLAMNLLLTFPQNGTFPVGGTQYPPGTPGNVTGTYNISTVGKGTIGLTAPATADYIIYAVTQTNLFMIQDASKDKGVASGILFMAQ